MTRRARLLLTAIVVVGGGAGVAAWRRGGKKPEPRFETVTIDRGRIVGRVTATGTLSALVTVQVGSQVSGRLSQILVDFNSRVKKGQVIARLDAQLFQAAVEQARANHMAAQANVQKARVQVGEAERQLARTRALAEKNLVAAAELDTAQAGAESARAQVAASEGALAQTRAALHHATINLGYTTIVSPIDGVVISRNVDVGQTVAASLQAPTLFTIAEDLRKMQVDTSVAEADVGKLKPGMAASFTVDAYPGEKFRGTVRQVRNAPQTVQNVVTYDAVIDVENGDLRLKPGMTANVTFIWAEKDGVLRVPNAALRFRPPAEMMAASGSPDGGAPRNGTREARPGGMGGGLGDGRDPGRRREEDGSQRRVWALRAGRPQLVPIKVGLSDGTISELVEGDLKEGDALITEIAGGEAKRDVPPMMRRGL